jgi:hypothetical protein
MELDFAKYRTGVFIPEIAFFEETLNVIQRKFPRPEFTNEGKHNQWRYTKPDRIHVCILKSVRIISGLNSCLVLLESGHISEVAVILRTINEFQGDIISFEEKTSEYGFVYNLEPKRALHNLKKGKDLTE